MLNYPIVRGSIYVLCFKSFYYMFTAYWGFKCNFISSYPGGTGKKEIWALDLSVPVSFRPTPVHSIPLWIVVTLGRIQVDKSSLPSLSMTASIFSVDLSPCHIPLSKTSLWLPLVSCCLESLQPLSSFCHVAWYWVANIWKSCALK